MSELSHESPELRLVVNNELDEDKLQPNLSDGLYNSCYSTSDIERRAAAITTTLTPHVLGELNQDEQADLLLAEVFTASHATETDEHKAQINRLINQAKNRLQVEEVA